MKPLHLACCIFLFCETFVCWGNASKILTLAADLPNTTSVRCPEAQEISPCSCQILEATKLKVQCLDSKVRQEHVNNVLEKLRQVNDINSTNDDWLYLHDVYVQRTLMTQLDLSSFIRVHMFTLYIDYNEHLTTILGPSLSNNTTSESFQGLIDVKELALAFNSLTDQGVHDTLKYFSNKMTWLNLRDNKLQHSLNYIKYKDQYLLGLSELVNLEILSFSNNSIKKMGGGQFKRNNILQFTLYNEN